VVVSTPLTVGCLPPPYQALWLTKLLKTDQAPASVQDQVANHELNAVKYYLNKIVDFDTAAAFHRRVLNKFM
jgi:hypothetical protein